MIRKNTLKSGMVVRFRKGTKGLVGSSGIELVIREFNDRSMSFKETLFFKEYCNKDMKHKSHEDYDVIAVYNNKKALFDETEEELFHDVYLSNLQYNSLIWVWSPVQHDWLLKLFKGIKDNKIIASSTHGAVDENETCYLWDRYKAFSHTQLEYGAKL